MPSIKGRKPKGFTGRRPRQYCRKCGQYQCLFLRYERIGIDTIAVIGHCRVDGAIHFIQRFKIPSMGQELRRRLKYVEKSSDGVVEGR